MKRFDYTLGSIYRDDFSGELVEFLGVAVGETGEDLDVFRFIESPGTCLVVRPSDYQRGQTFTSASDEIEDDLAGE